MTVPARKAACIDSGQILYWFLMKRRIKRVNPKIQQIFRFKLKA